MALLNLHLLERANLPDNPTLKPYLIFATLTVSNRRNIVKTDVFSILM